MEMLKDTARHYLPDIYRSLADAWNSLKRPSVPAITSLPNGKWNTRMRQTMDWFDNVQNFLQVNRIDGVYAEFGCHEIKTFRFALNTLGQYRRPNKISHFYAFDSFEGMPEPEGIDKQKIWRKGMNHTTLERFKAVCKKDLHRITATKGFFCDSLPGFNWNAGHKIACAYIDVDYYSSTREVLNFITGKLQHGAIIGFDDWNCYYGDPSRGMRKAFTEWSLSLSGIARLEPYLPISWGGQSFIYQELNKLGKEIL